MSREQTGSPEGPVGVGQWPGWSKQRSQAIAEVCMIIWSGSEPLWAVREAKQECLQPRASTVQPGQQGPSSELGLRCQIVEDSWEEPVTVGYGGPLWTQES